MRREPTGRAGLQILRDNHDIPHIYGRTRDDVMFGSGWMAAEDRGLLLLEGIGPAYLATLDVPGLNPFSLVTSARSFTPNAKTIRSVAAQENALRRAGAKGRQVLRDLQDWIDGINAYEASPGQTGPKLPHAKPTDAIAGLAFIGSIFGSGGGNEVANSGDEVANSDFLVRLRRRLGLKPGTQVFHDLREVNDPEAPTTIRKAFPYDRVPKRATPGAMVIDPGSQSSSASAAVATVASRRLASNFVIAGRTHSADGHPLAVMGPQLSYYYPEIVMQGDLYGGGINARGSIAPIAPYVFIGRGRDFAWSLTSAGSQNEQQFVEQLCDPSGSAPTRASTHYLYRGHCRAMQRFDAGRLGAGSGEPARELTFYQSVHGHASGTVTVHGRPYAVALDRFTRGHKPAASSRSVNWTQVACILPRTSSGRSTSSGPHSTGLTSTANRSRTSPRAGAADHGAGDRPEPTHAGNGRVRLARSIGCNSTRASPRACMKNNIVSIMNRAATEDLRTIAVWPIVRRDGGPPPSQLAAHAAGLIERWRAHGARRVDLNRRIDDPGAAVMDTAWDGIARAVRTPVLGPLTNILAQMIPTSSTPSFEPGWFGYVSKDLRTELGMWVRGAYSRRYCGNGSLKACRASLWAAIQAAAVKLAASQGVNGSTWHSSAAAERITFTPGLIPFAMRWTNRSTFQQVIEFTGPAAR